jgi:hypothetical protein
VHAVHPEHGVIFLTAGKLRSLMSYDMDKKKVRFIWTLGESNLSVHPYVPCFSDWLFFFRERTVSAQFFKWKLGQKPQTPQTR